METRSRIDDELEAIRLQKNKKNFLENSRRKLKLETLKQEENFDNIIIETDLETQEK